MALQCAAAKFVAVIDHQGRRTSRDDASFPKDTSTIYDWLAPVRRFILTRRSVRLIGQVHL